MNTFQLREELKEATNQLLDAIDGVSEEKLNTQPSGGGWTIGQVAEHLIKVETATIRLFTGDVRNCDRDPEKNIPAIKSRFLDFDNKMKAFGPIVPDDEPKEKQKVLSKLQDLRQRLISMIEIEDLTKLVTGFEHPLFGILTKVEWLSFHIYHSRRHTKQIQKIASDLATE